MATCPNTNLDSWKNLVAARGEDIAYYLWDKFDGNVPDSESRESIVKSGIKATNALQSPKAAQLFSTLEKNKVTGDAFWNKIQSDLQIPKDQIELLKQYNTTDRDELITNMLADYSFAIEINVALNLGQNYEFYINNETETYALLNEYGDLIRQFETLEELETYRGERPTKIYANLIVPGGTNYTENEIATPAITPAIKGHAQFATDKGIGWFRSDDKAPIIEGFTENKEAPAEWELEDAVLKEEPKTRRILEVQSDLFQKGRDRSNLIDKKPNESRDLVEQTPFEDTWQVVNSQIGVIESGFKTKEEAEKWLKTPDTDNKNQFLQLLNKGANWVTFFVKSIIQDSAKKGYEKVLFPSGDTASKVEGHQSLEDFKKDRENRIKELEDNLSSLYAKQKSNVKEIVIPGTFTIEYKIKNDLNEIKVYKQELERVEKEGFAALRPIYNFYENTVKNVLKKQGYNPKQVTDEYGNTWNEVSLKKERDSQKILFQIEDMSMSAASKETLNKVKEAAKKMGIDIKSLTDYAKAHPEIDVTGINGVADLLRGVIAISEGKEDVALTEEMVHIATAILEQTNPKLITEMISKIGRFKIYNETLKAYKDDKNYQLPNGKPDIRKIKKEAMDKLIVEVMINKNEGSTEFPELMEQENFSLIERIWNVVRDWISGIYRKADINIFEEAAAQILGGEIGDVSDITEGGVFFQKITDEQQKIVDGLERTKDFLEKKVVENTKVEPILLDTEEAQNFYEVTKPDGTKKNVLKRVTDRVKEWYADRFPGKKFTEAEKIFNELKRKFGIEGHKDFEEIHARYYNSDGTKKSKPDPRPRKFNLPSEEMYSKLEKYYVDLIKTFPKDTLILSEVIVYDPTEDEAGTIDFIAVEPSGKTHILDWKFMYIAADKDDVAWFKQGAYGIQLGRYKEILKKNYGVKEFGMTRAIPFLMNFKPKNKFDITKGWTLSGISAGSANPADIEDLRLIPIAEETESTGEKEVDNLIVKLNALLKQIESEKPAESEKQFKIERLNTLRQTIRIIQATGNIAPLIDTIEVMRKEGERILNDYDAIYKDRPAKSTDSKDKELSDFSDDMNNYLTLSDVFANIANDIGDLIYNDDMIALAKTKAQKQELKDKKEALDKLTYESAQIYKSRKAIKEVSEKFADKHIGQRNTVVGLLRPEAIVKGLSSLFRGVADLPLASLNILYKVVRNAQGKADADAFEEAKRIMDIRKKIVDKGVNVRDYIKQIYQKDDDGGFVNKLIHKFSKEFLDTVDDKATAGGDRQWLLQNIDLEGYKKEAKTVIERRLGQINKQSFSGSDTEVKAKKRKAAEDVLREFDISRKDFNGFNNYIIKRHPLPKWYSEEYKIVEKDPDLLELYNFIVSFNEKAKDVGYIDNQISKTFLPFIRKTMAESLSWDNSLTAIAKWNDTLKARTEDVGYGNINQISGKVENSIPKYYTYDFTRTEDGVNDYTDVSEDLFKNLILYVQQVNKYKYMTEVEGQLKLVKTIEEFKQNHLRTNRNGDVVIKEGTTEAETERGNEANAKMYDDFLRTILYDQKYILSDADIPLNIGKVVNFVKGAVNTVAGKEVLKPNEDPTPTSLIKLMDATNRAFQLKTLGLDVIPGAVNWFGSNLQMAAQIRDYFEFNEFFKNQGKLLNMEFKNDEEKQMYVDLFNTFMPLKDDPSYELYNEAGLTTLTKKNFGDILMLFMRYPETLVEKATFISLLQNTMVDENGKIVNIREYVKKKYKNRNASSTAYRETKDLINKEVEELKKTKSLDVTKKLENGKLVIPGLDLTNREELQRLTNLSRQISQNATGSMSKQNINRMSMSIWTKSMMVFKGWIPKLADTRFSELRKVIDDFSTEVKYDEEGNAYIEGQKYEIGRVRLLGYVMMTSMRDRAANITNILKMNDAGVLALDKLYDEFAKSYKARTGEDFNMSKEDFIDMVRTNLANQLQELAWLASLIAASIALGYIAPDDDDDKAAKNAYRYAQKVLDKFVSELSFFYNPLELESILSGSMFPAIGMINDILKFMQHFFLEITGFDFDPNTSYDDVRKKAQPIKYLSKALPVTKVALTYGAIVSSDFAKEFDITIQKESRR